VNEGVQGPQLESAAMCCFIADGHLVVLCMCRLSLWKLTENCITAVVNVTCVNAVLHFMPAQQLSRRILCSVLLVDGSRSDEVSPVADV